MFYFDKSVQKQNFYGKETVIEKLKDPDAFLDFRFEAFILTNLILIGSI